MKNRKLLPYISIVFIVVAWISQGLTFEKIMHEAINGDVAQRTINEFSLDNYLMNHLGFKAGVQEPLYGYSEIIKKEVTKEVWRWVGEGGIKEDEPEGLLRYPTNTARNNRHFHNPLESWDNAGLHTILFRAPSSIVWAQNPNQAPGGKWSWQDARDYFYKGLTTTSKAERESFFAKTFRALGQLMHLIHDASVPAHVRDDIHVIYHYENWVEDLRNNEPGTFSTWISNPKSYDKSILNLPPNPLAPIPIAKIIDADQYTRDNLDITATASAGIGLAEYSNGNFLSEDTRFDESFPFPNWDSVEQADYEINDPRNPLRMVLRQYYKKVRHGETNGEIGYRLATVGSLKDYVLTYFPAYARFLRRYERPALDANVYRDYASFLVPRAVGYSAGLLEYFFRGKLDFQQTDTKPNGDIEITITNLSEDTLVEGVFELYYDNDQGNRTQINLSQSAANNISKDGTFKTTFALPTDFDPAKKNEYMLVYRGQLGGTEEAGGEKGAVIGRHKLLTIRGILVFYRKDEIERIALLNYSDGEFHIDKDVLASDYNLEFPTYEDWTFPYLQKAFTHQDRTIYIVGIPIQLTGTKLSEGGIPAPTEGTIYYLYDPSTGEYHFLTENAVDPSEQLVFNVSEDYIYIYDYPGSDVTLHQYTYKDGELALVSSTVYPGVDAIGVSPDGLLYSKDTVEDNTRYRLGNEVLNTSVITYLEPSVSTTSSNPYKHYSLTNSEILVYHPYVLSSQGNLGVDFIHQTTNSRDEYKVEHIDIWDGYYDAWLCYYAEAGREHPNPVVHILGTQWGFHVPIGHIVSPLDCERHHTLTTIDIFGQVYTHKSLEDIRVTNSLGMSGPGYPGYPDYPYGYWAYEYYYYVDHNFIDSQYYYTWDCYDDYADSIRVLQFPFALISGKPFWYREKVHFQYKITDEPVSMNRNRVGHYCSEFNLDSPANTAYSDAGKVISHELVTPYEVISKEVASGDYCNWNGAVFAQGSGILFEAVREETYIDLNESTTWDTIIYCNGNRCEDKLEVLLGINPGDIMGILIDQVLPEGV